MPTPSDPIVVDSSVRAGDQFRVAMAMVLRNPASLGLFIGGPLLWALGMASRSDVVIELGERISWLVVLVPAFAALVGSFAAYRPGSSALYQPVQWTFSVDGVEIEQPSRRARASWDEFIKWRREAECYLLHTTDRDYVVVPVRDVPSDRREQFEALLTAHIGERRG